VTSDKEKPTTVSGLVQRWLWLGWNGRYKRSNRNRWAGEREDSDGSRNQILKVVTFRNKKDKNGVLDIWGRAALIKKRKILIKKV